MRSWRGGSWEDAGGLGLASSSDDGMLGEGTLKRSSGGGDTSRADSDGTGASCGGSGCGGTGSSTLLQTTLLADTTCDVRMVRFELEMKWCAFISTAINGIHEVLEPLV